MICARRTSPAPSFCERVIRASLCASSSLNPRTRSVIATSPAWTRAPCNAPDPEKSYPTCRMHHLGIVFDDLLAGPSALGWSGAYVSLRNWRPSPGAIFSRALVMTDDAADVEHVAYKPGFPRWIRPAGPKTAEMLAKLPVSSFTRRVRQDSATRSSIRD